MSANLASILTDTAVRLPDAIAYKLDDVEVSFKAVDEGSARVAGLLKAKHRHRALPALVTKRADGALLVTWGDVHDFTQAGPRESRAALRPGPRQPFGAPELIATSSPGLAGGGRTLVAAFDPRTGRPAAAWTAANDGSDVLQVATRSG